MAKKVVATLKKAGEGKDYVKVFRAVKSKNGAYSFQESIVTGEEAKTHFK
ncbi:MAG: DUF4295 family protein [Bacteroidota bacterium]|jgi:hypothetical protein|nr:DUF4295 family protein [Bacteroidota bacterium]